MKLMWQRLVLMSAFSLARVICYPCRSPRLALHWTPAYCYKTAATYKVGEKAEKSFGIKSSSFLPDTNVIIEHVLPIYCRICADWGKKKRSRRKKMCRLSASALMCRLSTVLAVKIDKLRKHAVVALQPRSCWLHFWWAICITPWYTYLNTS